MALAVPVRSIKSALALATEGCISGFLAKYSLFLQPILVPSASSMQESRCIARAQRSTLNEAFREWLRQYTQSAGDAQSFDAMMRQLQHVDAGRHFSRNEMNER